MSLVVTMIQRMAQVSLRVRERRKAEGGQTSRLTTSSPGVRDYIHVVDLAKGHIAALKKLKEQCGCRVGSQGGKGLESRANVACGVDETPIQHPVLLGRSTTWAQAQATLSCRWSKQWRRLQGRR